jgi:hypothetical protein
VFFFAAASIRGGWVARIVLKVVSRTDAATLHGELEG